MTEQSSQKQINRYNNSKIYKLVERNTNYFSIGSTASKLSKRFGEHKRDALRQPDRPVFECYNSIEIKSSSWRKILRYRAFWKD